MQTPQTTCFQLSHNWLTPGTRSALKPLKLMASNKWSIALLISFHWGVFLLLMLRTRSFWFCLNINKQQELWPRGIDIANYKFSLCPACVPQSSSTFLQNAHSLTDSLFNKLHTQSGSWNIIVCGEETSWQSFLTRKTTAGWYGMRWNPEGLKIM